MQNPTSPFCLLAATIALAATLPAMARETTALLLAKATMRVEVARSPADQASGLM
jgi:hypothetical protein